MTTPKTHQCIDEQKLIDDIQKFGWAVILVEATDYLPSFAYTIGLWRSFTHPELISFGLSTKTLHMILNIGGELIKSGQSLVVEKEYDDFFENGPAQLLTVDHRILVDYFAYAIWFNGSIDFPALQIVWVDRNNRFPWHADYEEEFRYRQPLLDRNTQFKFREEKRLAIFTTRQWVEDSKPILRVIHETDGDWQFLTGDQMPEDVKIVALEQMVLRDQSLNDLFNLDYGEEAERNFIGDRWKRKTSRSDE